MKNGKLLKGITAIVLAAGRGTRMKTPRPKVLEPILGKAMLDWVLETIKGIGIRRTVLVVGYQAEVVRAHVRDRGDIVCVNQSNPLGTADAIRYAKDRIPRDCQRVLVLYGDTPLFRIETLRHLIEQHCNDTAVATFISTEVPDPAGYGRVVRDWEGKIKGIVEEKVLSSEQERAIREINTGAYLFERGPLFEGLPHLKANDQGEFYLTDLITSWAQMGLRVQAIQIKNKDEGLGVNTFEELTQATGILKARVLEKHHQSGVDILDPATTYIADGVQVGKGTRILPFTVIESDVVIGEDCTIGPFARIRPGSEIQRGAEIGNFVEINRSTVGRKTLVKHLTYLGDAQVGALANIGAGTITANFNGHQKNKTIIGDEASIGSHTVLVAPVRVGKRAITGAGCVVPKRKHVPPGAVVVGVPARILRK